MKQLLLVGAGHAHLLPLSRAREFIKCGIAVTLIAPGRFWYSGMGPGMVSRFYEPEDDTVDVQKLVERHGGRFIRGKVTAIDPAGRQLHLHGGGTVRYDALSLNVGSEVPLDLIPGAAQFGLPVKPIKNLFVLREALAKKAATEDVEIIVVGGGAAGCEVSANISRFLADAAVSGRVTLISSEPRLLSEAPRRASSIITDHLQRQAVRVINGSKAVGVQEGEVTLANGMHLPFHLLVVAVGIRAPIWLRESGLPCASDGSIRVNEFLQCTAHDEIFGAGDCICFGEDCLPRVGVYAVRQAQILLHNLRAFLSCGELKKFIPQKKYMLLLNLADGTALLTRGNFSVRNRAAFWLKNWIDRRFVRSFQQPT